MKMLNEKAEKEQGKIEKNTKTSYDLWKEKSEIPWDSKDLSPSRLSHWGKCPASYEYYYIQKIRGGDRDYFMMGNILDEVVMEEFRHDFTQDIDDIVELAADTLMKRMTESDTLTKSNGDEYTLADMKSTVMDFRTWVRHFLRALQEGQDSSGRAVHLPVISDSQTEAFWTVNIDGVDVRLRGFADLVHEDGSVTDLKMASPLAAVMWTDGKVMSELQWVIYSQGLNTNKFRYLVMDKKAVRSEGRRVAAPCEVRVLSHTVYPKDVENVKKKITSFLRSTDFLNGHKTGVFPPTPLYNGIANKFGSRPKALQLTQNNFCQHLCDYKEQCFKEHFSGDHRMDEPSE